jgi:hypothetical protein
VQPKAITFPTDANLLHAAIRGLVRLAKKHGVRLRQSYLRVAKHAAMMAGRYAHAKQFNRYHRQLQLLRTRVGRLIRDIGRKIAGHADLEAAFAWPLACANQIRSQQQRQRGWKLYSFHAAGVGKGKASAPYEFGVKVAMSTRDSAATIRRTRGASSSHIRTETRRLWRDQTRTQAPIRHRSRDRPHEDRRSPRPLPSPRPRRRCRQRHPHRGRLQLPRR